MSSASLTTSPSNPSSSRSNRMAAGLTVAGSGPSERTTTCAVITALTPASTAARNGSSSGASTTGSSWCESCRVSPWPGKCLAQAATPARCVPRTNAATWRATSSGTEPKARIPITGLSGFVFTSATGARFRFTPDGGELGRDRGGDRLGQLHVVDDAEAERARERAPVLDLEPRHVAALLVERDQQPRRVLPQRRRQRGQLLPVVDVRGEEADAAEPVREPRPQPVRALRPGEARDEADGREPGVRGDHPRTAPAVRPNAIRRCTRMKKKTTGSAVRVAEAISVPQSTPRSVPVVKFASQIVTVCFSWEESIT